MSLARAARLRALRARLSAYEPALHKGRTFRFADERIDGCFPAGGLPKGCWHELEGAGAEADDASLAAAFAGRLAAGLAGTGEAVWVLRRDDLYAPGLAELGIAPGRLIVVRTRSEAETLAAVEDALGTRGVSVVVGEVERVELTAGRRLQLACERRGVTALLVKRRLFGKAAGGPARAEPAVAASRWRISPWASEPPPGEPGLGPPRWRLELLRARGGRPGQWIVETPEVGFDGDVHNGAVPFRVVAELADHQLAAPEPGGRDDVAPLRRAAG
jgi:protein ImuA